MSKKHRKVCTSLSYIAHFLILTSRFTGCISIYAFTYLIGILVGITSSAIRLKISAMAAGIKKYKSMILKKKRRMIK